MSKIKKITLEIGGKDVEMTLKEARELKGALDELFPAPAYPAIPWSPQSQPARPVYPDPTYPWTGTPILCGVPTTGIQ